ncbi:MAG: GspE/PulE family protein [Elusimicrobiota bacterium]|jgi:type II secretory ATPase GspE/PulE/Tfp pilus assembly ATPase PilB-like protein
MSTSLQLAWVTSRGNAWCELFAIDIENAYFKNLEGVYVVWRGGVKPETIKVGQGSIRDNILAMRADPEVVKCKDSGLFLTWVALDKAQRDGVERFLRESLHPKIKTVSPAAAPVEVNLPGRDALGKSGVGGGPQVGQMWDEMATRAGDAPGGLQAHDVEFSEAAQAAPAAAAQPAAPKLKVVSNLQKLFDEYMAKAKKPAARGLFSRSDGAAPPEDDDIVKYVTQLVMREAMLARASDIHMEPWEDRLSVRFRIDGMLEEVLVVPATANVRLVSHIRVRCGLDPEKGAGMAKPQDGRMMVTVDSTEADLRLATFPTNWGDKAVMRILPRKNKVPTIEEMGLRPVQIEAVRELIARPQGMIIVTGPTGSGKSTTLYTLLHALNSPARNIVTLEDPIEMRVPGIIQGAIQPKIGFTFAEGLRSILRQDPNIVMVGEVRDTETAEIALRAALTGHLLFTTLHTNSALGAVTRLLDMGIEPFLITSAVTAVFAQRLVRGICPKCRETYRPGPEELAQLVSLAKRVGVSITAESFKEICRGQGCPACRQTGFRGRLLVFEMVRISETLRPLILRKASLDELHAEAVRHGMETMFVDGLHKVKAGLTTLDEVVRIAGAGE